MRPENRLLMALLASSAIHAAGVLSVLELARSAPAAASAEPTESVREIRVGIDRSVVETLTWLGFEIPSPHEAEFSRVEQAAFTMAASPAGSAIDRVNVPINPLAVIGRSAEQAQSPSLADTASAPPPLAEGERGVPMLERPDGTVEIPGAVESVRVALPAGGPTAVSTSSPADSPGAGGDGREALDATAEIRPGAPSDRESPATSLTKPLRVRPGKPASAEGLTIKTRIPPSFSIPTTILSQGRRAVYRVSFGGDGLVKKVEVARSSGDPNVDEPGRTALYSWTAEGEVLAGLATGEAKEGLAGDDPRRFVTVYIELLAAGV